MAAEPTQRDGVIHGIKVDVRRLHEHWMGLMFPRQRSGGHSVLGRWTPSTTRGKIGYRLWSVLGMLIVGVLYPLMLVGVMTRFYSRRVNLLLAWIGVFGVVILAAVVWGALTVVAHFQLSHEGFLAVGAAAAVATVAAFIAAITTKFGGRLTTIIFAYPAAMTAIFLPPIVAALFSPYLGDLVFPRNEAIAIWILDNVLVVGDINEWLRDQYELDEVGHVLMWFGISVPIGWLLGILVSLADLIRPAN